MNEPKKSEIETIETEGLIWVFPKGAKHKPIKISSVENILEKLQKAGVLEMAEPLKPDWTTEDEERRRELTWKDFTEGLASVRETAVSGVVALRQQCDIMFDKRKFLDNPRTYTTERMDALIRWAENQKKTVVGYVERTMKAYGPEDEK